MTDNVERGLRQKVVEANRQYRDGIQEHLDRLSKTGAPVGEE